MIQAIFGLRREVKNKPIKTNEELKKTLLFDSPYVGCAAWHDVGDRLIKSCWPVQIKTMPSLSRCLF